MEAEIETREASRDLRSHKTVIANRKRNCTHVMLFFGSVVTSFPGPCLHFKMATYDDRSSSKAPAKRSNIFIQHRVCHTGGSVAQRANNV